MSQVGIGKHLTHLLIGTQVVTFMSALVGVTIRTAIQKYRPTVVGSSRHLAHQHPALSRNLFYMSIIVLQQRVAHLLRVVSHVPELLLQVDGFHFRQSVNHWQFVLLFYAKHNHSAIGIRKS